MKPSTSSPELARGAPYALRVEARPRTAGSQCSGGEIAHALERSAARAGPYCIYVHVPFCAYRCSFCALYTTLLPEGREAAAAERFTEVLIETIAAHPWAGAARGPTTVHFGGGTPLTIGAARLARVAGAIRRAFAADDACEWAIETTASSLTPETVDQLWSMGFRRLHVGVQTLEQTVRAAVGRQLGSEEVLTLIAALCDRGFSVSVDLMLGLAGTDASSALRDIEHLHGAGVHMFSLCELRLRHGRRSEGEHGANFAAWRAVWARMARLGIGPIHIGQFGRSPRDNLYFTHPARGEACIALGPYAHGEFGDYWYQNQLLGAFDEAPRGAPIRAGLRFEPQARVFAAFERALLAHNIPPEILRDCLDAREQELLALFRSWERAAYFVVDKGNGHISPTCEGSWFIGNMLADFRAALEERPCAEAAA